MVGIGIKISRSKEEKNSVYLATSKKLKGVVGKYFISMRPFKSHEITYKKEVQDKCWNININL
ncbi:MAG: hypothetical protein DRN08_05820 [Thermoplasmata archaeon]|nr:MAG: hypothetical protein DRN08_05820 [Thermoplasmata archaeon]